MERQFIHLHVHSDHSLLDGACRIDRLLKRVKELGMPSIALTDHGNLFGIPTFYKAAKKAGIKPLLGCEVYLMHEGSHLDKKKEVGSDGMKLSHLGLIAMNWTGYRNLVKLVSISHVDGFYYKPRIDMALLERYSDGLIALTGCMTGILSQYILRGELNKANSELSKFVDIFGRSRLFVEVQNHGMPEQAELVPALVSLANKFDLKVVATNDVHYVYKEDFEAQDALLCIQTGSKVSDERRMRMPTRQFYIKSAEEMLMAFKDYPEAIDNTLLIHDMCDVTIPFGENHYPVFSRSGLDKEKFSSNAEYFKALCVDGLMARYNIRFDTCEGPYVFGQSPKAVIDRLKYEWATIEQMGFVDYFLVVWDFIHWAKVNGIPVGPGRGSVAGSIVAYLLTITDTDPLRFDLLFERFLNPERVSPPDIDIDFCMRRREEVIKYVREKYGDDNVGNIITFGTFGAKMVVRDLARVYDMPYSEADRIAKMIPDDLKITLSTAVERSKELRDEISRNSLVEKIFEDGKIIEGMVRNSGTHAAGIIIWDKPLTEIVPTTLQEGSLTTQYSKDYVEDLGLLKMDFLGLRTLTVIDDAQRFIRSTTAHKDFDISKIPLEDCTTFKMLNAGRTIGVFQLESPFIQKICKQFEMNSIDEISALSALNRPGPMDWIPDYINGKKNSELISYVHPLLEPICKKTYGVLVFQEQVMEAARVVAGYTLAGADILRRAMGKKKVEEMNAQREIFVAGAWEHNGIPESTAGEIFDILAKFAGYGFNKSHSDAYAIIIYHTAYLKANFPTQFMAAILSSELGNAEKLAFFIEECKAMSISIFGPDINESYDAFTPIVTADGKKQIRFGLSAIKGVGEVASKSILDERGKNGNYLSFNDFIMRSDTKVTNKRVMECLIKSGAFDAFAIDRKALLTNLESQIKEAAAIQSDRAKGQATLFDFDSIDSVQVSPKVQIACAQEKMSLSEKLNNEKELLGFYLSGHPLDQLNGLDRVIQGVDDEDFAILPSGEEFRLCGIIEEVEKRISKKTNRPWMSFVLVTKTNRFSLQLFSESFDKYANMMQDGLLVCVEGVLKRSKEELRMNVMRVYQFEKSFKSLIKECHWILENNSLAEDFITILSESINEFPGNTIMRVSFKINDDYALEGELPRFCGISLTLDKLNALRSHAAVYGVEVSVADIAPFPMKAHGMKTKNSL